MKPPAPVTTAFLLDTRPSRCGVCLGQFSKSTQVPRRNRAPSESGDSIIPASARMFHEVTAHCPENSPSDQSREPPYRLALPPQGPRRSRLLLSAAWRILMVCSGPVSVTPGILRDLDIMASEPALRESSPQCPLHLFRFLDAQLVQ